MIKLFITATDTDAGKTYVARAITLAMANKGLSVSVFKPISAGCQVIKDNNIVQLINEDALLLSKVANCNQSIEQINPIAFEKPIAPHIAANELNARIELAAINQHYESILTQQPEVILTEGAGGWRLPLGNGLFLSEFVKQSQQKVVLVVNMKLGCLNHAVLTYESIIADGVPCLGWVANCQEQMDYLQENIDELKNILPIPLLAKLNKEPDIEIAANKINIEPLL